MEKINKENFYLLTFSLLPVTLLVGPLVSEITLVMLILCFVLKKESFNERKLIIFFSLFFLSTITSTLISKYFIWRKFSKIILKSIFHLRFLILFMIILIVLKKKKISKKI